MGEITLMAGTNDFKAFATDANANVTSQEEWETLTALKKGFSSGKASSAQVSKALRQPSTMAAVLGQFIANAELDALDDGDVDGLVAKLATAITTNLGLGEAAKRNVGTGDNQIPDMGAFASGSGWFRLPGGYIVQFGTFSGNTTRFISGHFPIPFPNQPMVSVSVMSDAVQSDPSNPAPQVLSVNFEHISNSAWRVATSDISQQYRFSYISIGW
ncbi:gp53-like domain-containing protein [Escherichia coli]